MEVELRCYGEVRSVVGATSVRYELPAGATVDDAVDALAADHPDIRRDGLVVMRDRRHVDPDDALTDGDALALSGPVVPE